MNTPSSELNANSRLGLETELIARESREKVGFADAGVSDEHYFEQVIVIVVCSVRPHSQLCCAVDKIVCICVSIRN